MMRVSPATIGHGEGSSTNPASFYQIVHEPGRLRGLFVARSGEVFSASGRMGRHGRHEHANALQSPHSGDLGIPVAAAVGLHLLFGYRVAGEILARDSRL